MSIALYLQTHAPRVQGEQAQAEPQWTNPFVASIAAAYVHGDQASNTFALLPASIKAGMSEEIPAETQLGLEDTKAIFCADERELLMRIWATIGTDPKPRIVTFNGRKFTVPFLYLRSSFLRVPIRNFDLLKDRYKLGGHIDLLEAYTFHGIQTKPGLLQLAELYGLPLPVTKEGSNLQVMLEDVLRPENPSLSPDRLQAARDGRRVLWSILAKSGVEYTRLIFALENLWKTTLQQAY